MPIVPIMTPTSADVQSPAHEQLKISERVVPMRRPSVRLSGPLDATPVRPGTSEGAAPTISQTHKTSGRHTPVRRDSLDRREAFLKGKEGSRQRRRWENDRLLSNPWAVAPLQSDYEVRPTYPTRSVPYYLAPLWDAAEFQRSVEAKLQGRQSRKSANKHTASKRGRMSPAEETASNVPKEVRAKLKRARAAKGMLQDLEEQVRMFLQKWNERQALREKDGLGDAPVPRTPRQSFHLVKKPNADLGVSDSALLSDSDTDAEVSDEEIVFIGRNGTTLDSPGRKARETEALGLDTETLRRDKLVYEGPEADKGAGFARWLVHSIGAYYGLKTWSVTTEGQPAMREAYVGVDRAGWGRYAGRCQVLADVGVELPRPLYGMV